MNIRHYSNARCDKTGCPNQTVSTSDRGFTCSMPPRWAEVTWSEPPKEGKEHGTWEELILCPDHLNSLLKWLATQEE